MTLITISRPLSLSEICRRYANHKRLDQSRVGASELVGISTTYWRVRFFVRLRQVFCRMGAEREVGFPTCIRARIKEEAQ